MIPTANLTTGTRPVADSRNATTRSAVRSTPAGLDDIVVVTLRDLRQQLDGWLEQSAKRLAQLVGVVNQLERTGSARLLDSSGREAARGRDSPPVTADDDRVAQR